MLLEKTVDTGIDSDRHKLASTSDGLSARTRPHVSGKFLFVGETQFYVKGVSYGAFRPDEAKNEYHDLEQIERDFAQMAAHGINTVRIPHTMPPRVPSDIAQRYGLRVMVGLSAEQYVGYLIDKKRAPNIEKMMREKVRTVVGHPALLCYGIGNEIPASVARWLGNRRKSSGICESHLCGSSETKRTQKGSVAYVELSVNRVPSAPIS